MFYVSSYKDNLIGVTDSEDNIEEFYTKEFLDNLGIDIIRFNKELPSRYEFETECFICTLVNGGWRLRCKDGVKSFRNKSSYLGYPVTNLKDCFSDYEYYEISLSEMDTSNVTNMAMMFFNCVNLTFLDLTNFDTSKVTDMNMMFLNCRNLVFVKLDNWNTSNVTNMKMMFKDCLHLKTIGLDNFDTSNVLDMSYMFSDCMSLESLDLSSFNGANVTDTSYMFFGCASLTHIDISNFKARGIKNASYMFALCTDLLTVDLDGIEVLGETGCMFKDCNHLALVRCDDKSILKNANHSFRLTRLKLSNCDYLANIKLNKGFILSKVAVKILSPFRERLGYISYTEVR